MCCFASMDQILKTNFVDKGQNEVAIKWLTLWQNVCRCEDLAAWSQGILNHIHFKYPFKFIVLYVMDNQWVRLFDIFNFHC